MSLTKRPLTIPPILQKYDSRIYKDEISIQLLNDCKQMFKTFDKEGKLTDFYNFLEVLFGLHIPDVREPLELIDTLQINSKYMHLLAEANDTFRNRFIYDLIHICEGYSDTDDIKEIKTRMGTLLTNIKTVSEKVASTIKKRKQTPKPELQSNVLYQFPDTGINIVFKPKNPTRLTLIIILCIVCIYAFITVNNTNPIGGRYLFFLGAGLLFVGALLLMDLEKMSPRDKKDIANKILNQTIDHPGNIVAMLKS